MPDPDAQRELQRHLAETAERLHEAGRGIGLGKAGRAAKELRDAAEALRQAADAVGRL